MLPETSLPYSRAASFSSVPPHKNETRVPCIQHMVLFRKLLRQAFPPRHPLDCGNVPDWSVLFWWSVLTVKMLLYFLWSETDFFWYRYDVKSVRLFSTGFDRYFKSDFQNRMHNEPYNHSPVRFSHHSFQIAVRIRWWLWLLMHASFYFILSVLFPAVCMTQTACYSCFCRNYHMFILFFL